MEEEKKDPSYDDLIGELFKHYAEELRKEIFLKPTILYSSVSIKDLDKMGFPLLKKKPWWLEYKYRIIDAWKILRGKAEIYEGQDQDPY